MTFKSPRRQLKGKKEPMKTIQKVSYRSKYSPYEKFLKGMHNPETRRTYIYHLKNFLEFSEFADYPQLLEIPDTEKTDLIQEYIQHMQGKSLAYQTINTAVAAVKLFYDQNGVEQLGWKRLSKQKGKRKAAIKDRTYTATELKQLYEHADLRERVMILLLLSTGIRVGALAGLKRGDLTYIEQDKHYQVKAYSEDIGEDYFTFTTPECATEIDKYFKFREEKEGETITKNTPVITHKITSTSRYKNKGFLTSQALQKILERQRYDANIMKASKLSTTKGNTLGRIRKEVMRSHGFRKIFNTKCMDLAIYPPYKEALMGHSLGLDKSYWRPENQEKIRQEYLKVIDELTIDDSNKLRLQNVQLHKEVEEIQLLKKQVQELLNEKGKLETDFTDALQDAFQYQQHVDQMKKELEALWESETYSEFTIAALTKKLQDLEKKKMFK